MKTCNKCGLSKELSEFHKDKHKKDGLYDAIHQCVEEALLAIGDEIHELSIFCIEEESKGATCGYAPSADEHLDVDHCHDTGQVRGLLCRACNTTLGKVKDNTDTLRSMIDYLEAGGASSRFYI